MYILPETELLKAKQIKKEKDTGVFIFEPLSPGYGVTIGNSLRRVLLSSLEGAAVSDVKIDGITHEFSTLSGMKEDVVELILNLKGLRFRLHGDGPFNLKLKEKGPKEITAADFEKNPEIEIVNPDHYLASLDKNGKLEFEIGVEKGRGYMPTEKKKDQTLPLGVIAIDSIFTPIKKVHYEVENTRVGGMTNFDKLTLTIVTDGTIAPEEALKKAGQIIIEHFGQLLSFKETGKIKEKKVVSEEMPEEELEQKPEKKPKAKKPKEGKTVKKEIAKKTKKEAIKKHKKFKK